MVVIEVECVCVVDIVLWWGIGYDMKVCLFVNIIVIFKGGMY